jgi:hypothetical protein
VKINNEFNEVFHTSQMNNPDQMEGSLKYNQLKDEIRRHKTIKVSSADWLDAYYYNTSFCCRVFCCVRKPHSKLDRLYKRSVSKLQDELNLVKLIKDVKKLNNL